MPEKRLRTTAEAGIAGAFAGETITRRRFMSAGAQAAGAIAGAAIGLPALAFALGPVFERAPVCPGHGGVYAFRGRRIGGPPPRPLDRFYTRIGHGQVELGPRYSVNSELRRFSPRYSGEPLDGIGQYLYPARPTTPEPPR